MTSKRVGFSNRWAALRSCLGQSAQGFTAPREPHSIGNAQIGEQLLAGQYLFGGELITAPQNSIWGLRPLTYKFAVQCHGFEWLDHLVAQGGSAAQQMAQDWVFEWIALYGRGWGPGWTPQLSARRAIRLLNHSDFILRNAPKASRQKLLKALTHHSRFLAIRARFTPRGLARIEAMGGWTYCALLLQTNVSRLTSASAGLLRACVKTIANDGTIASRNPQELLEIFAILSWISSAMQTQNKTLPNDIRKAQERIASVLRSIRLGGGGLVHMQNGGRGMSGQLDRALRMAQVKLGPHRDHVMGYARLGSASAIAIVDAGPQRLNKTQQRSLLSFEFSNLRQPIIVNAGPGDLFGTGWRNATRDEPGQSALCVNDAPLSGSAHQINPTLTQSVSDQGDNQICAMHDGYVPRFGLQYERLLTLARGGNKLSGRDTVTANTPKAQKQFDRWIEQNETRGIPLLLRFHLMPGIRPKLSADSKKLTLHCPDGQVWQLRAPPYDLKLRDSAYMYFGHLAPIATKQVLINAQAVHYEGCITWTLKRRSPSK